MKKLISSETVFSTKWFEIDALSVVGSTEPYYVVSTSDYVVIVALTNEKDLLFVKQYRPALNEQTIELPSGHVEDDQTPQEAAHAELFEETGHQAVKMELLGCVSPDPGRLSNKLWCYYTDSAEEKNNTVLEPGLELIKIELSDIQHCIDIGSINHAMNLSALFLAKKRLNL